MFRRPPDSRHVNENDRPTTPELHTCCQARSRIHFLPKRDWMCLESCLNCR
ncbi:unnamed protein product [Mycena citricolor]|uniref:Uncharacterized protein n=1 Tax=Mycena citricolor TaxID=2018698 RepID=A0AAD2HZP7_9AGAR|nr:unnamed protein product [Mycena citricolor]